MELEKMQEIIAGVLSINPDEITVDTKFEDDLGADSLDVCQIIVEIENEYEIEVPQDAAEQIVTVGDAIEQIKSVIG